MRVRSIEKQHAENTSKTAKLLASLIASCIELIAFQPFQALTTRIQNWIGRILIKDFNKSYANLNQVIKKGGSLYSGLLANGVDKIVKRGIKFGGQSYIKEDLDYFFAENLEKKWQKKYVAVFLETVAGSLIGLCELPFLPTDYWKVNKLYDETRFKNRSVYTIFSREGYAGIIPAGIRNLFGGGFLFGFSSAAYWFLFKLDDPKEATLTQTLIASGVGSLASVALTMPPDVVKTRIQLATYERLDKTSYSIMKEMWQKEGSGAFFKGGAIKSAVSMVRLTMALTLYKTLELWLDEQLKQKVSCRPGL